ncbi:MAG: sulfatase-like hydrolase/transferase [Bryobacteraceae bacterium]|jgi:arylsulfatase A-like enzyme
MQFFSWMRTAFRAAVVFCLASAAGFCAVAPDPGQRPPIILISIDTLRADHVGVYGYRRIATPNIDSFAADGTLAASVACQTPLTLPSHTSLFTSTYPFESGIQENAEIVPPGAVTLAGVLRSRGYKTAAFIGGVFLERQMGLDQGFDTYDSPFDFEAFSPLSGEMFFGGVANPYSVRDRRDGVLVVAAALRWLAAQRGQPVFVFIHLFDLHIPYSLPEEAARRQGISRYDAQLAYVDGLIGRLKRGLVESGWWDKSLAILLSDHGEGLGDHGESLHGCFIYQSTVRVPLVFHWPVGSPARPPRIERPAGLIDVAPTILDYLAAPAPPSFVGTSLLGTAPRTVYSETLYTHDSFGWAALRSVRLGSYKYIDAPRPELYDLDKDPAERNNIVAANPGQARALRTELTNLLARYARRQPTDAAGATPDTRKLLASLGYLAPGPRTRMDGSAPDPKDRLAEYRLYEKSMDAVTGRRLNEAVALLLQILAKDPDSAVARRDLGSCYLDLHDYAKARASFEQVVMAAPDDYPSQFGLGMADKHLGLTGEARTHFEAACRLAPRAQQCRRELDALKQGAN